MHQILFSASVSRKTYKAPKEASQRTVAVAVAGGAVDDHGAHAATRPCAATAVLLDAHRPAPLQEGALHVLVPGVLLHAASLQPLGEAVNAWWVPMPAL